MELNFPSEANTRSAGQQNVDFYGHSVHRIYKSRPPVPVMSYVICVYILLPYFFETRFEFYLFPSYLVLPGLPGKIRVCFSSPHACYIVAYLIVLDFITVIIF
jgi:hypothetical protein